MNHLDLSPPRSSGVGSRAFSRLLASLLVLPALLSFQPSRTGPVPVNGAVEPGFTILRPTVVGQAQSQLHHVGGEIREGYEISSRNGLRLTLDGIHGGILETAVALLGGATVEPARFERYTLEVAFSDSHGEILLHTRRMGSRAEREWVDLSLSLDPLAGRKGYLHLRMSSQGGRWGGRFLLERPRVAVPVPRDAQNRPVTPQPDVILISIDTLRADGLGEYGHSEGRTPNLDRLAKEGVLFSDFTSSSSWTLPAHATMFTGLYPFQHGAWGDRQGIRTDCSSLAQILEGQKYRTAAFVTHRFLTSSYGFLRGFQVYRYAQDEEARKVTSRAARWLAASREPAFLFLHLFDPHLPYNPRPVDLKSGSARRSSVPACTVADARRLSDPDGRIPDGRIHSVRQAYDSEISAVDSALGHLVHSLRTGLRDRPVIVMLTADHGEEFREHGSMGHGVTLHREVVHIPWIVSYPGRLNGGRVVQTPAQLSDLFPTLLALLGLSEPGPLPGRDLLAKSTFDSAVPYRAIVSHTTRNGPDMYSIQLGPWKFIRAETSENHSEYRDRFGYNIQPPRQTPKDQLYRTDMDPAERIDLSKSLPEQVLVMKDELNRFLESVEGKESAELSLTIELEETDEELLRSLGYVL